MRNSERLNDFYNTFKALHQTYFPDLRFGQLMLNFFGWLSNDKKIDPFFPEEQKMIEYFSEYCNVCHTRKR